MAAAMLTGLVALVAGYAESQAASRFAFAAVSVAPQVLSDEITTPAVQPPETGRVIPKAAVKAHPRPVANADRPTRQYETVARSASDVTDAQTRLTLPASGDATFRMSIRVETDDDPVTNNSGSVENHSVRARRDSMNLLAEAAQELRSIQSTMWTGQTGMTMIDHRQRPSGN